MLDINPKCRFTGRMIDPEPAPRRACVSRSKLSPARIEAAAHMRREQALSWSEIGARLGVDSKTVRRAIDPSFDRATCATCVVTGTSEAQREHRTRQCGDLRFKRAMLRAREEGASESAHVVPGVVRGAGTRRPCFTPPRTPLRTTSPAALCAELGADL
jgi:hypothetical protein